MLRQTLHVASALCVVASTAFLTSCTTMTPSGGGGGGQTSDPNVEVKVAGTPAQFAAFDKALQSIIGTEPLGCSVMINGQVSACNLLQTSPVPSSATDLTYVFFGPHTSVYEKFGIAFNQVPKQFNPNLPTLTIRPIPVVAPDCSLLPQPCVPAPYCIAIGRCSQQQNQCLKCQ